MCSYATLICVFAKKPYIFLCNLYFRKWSRNHCKRKCWDISTVLNETGYRGHLNLEWPSVDNIINVFPNQQRIADNSKMASYITVWWSAHWTFRRLQNFLTSVIQYVITFETSVCFWWSWFPFLFSPSFCLSFWRIMDTQPTDWYLIGIRIGIDCHFQAVIVVAYRDWGIANDECCEVLSWGLSLRASVLWRNTTTQVGCCRHELQQKDRLKLCQHIDSFIVLQVRLVGNAAKDRHNCNFVCVCLRSSRGSDVCVCMLSSVGFFVQLLARWFPENSSKIFTRRICCVKAAVPLCLLCHAACSELLPINGFVDEKPKILKRSASEVSVRFVSITSL